MRGFVAQLSLQNRAVSPEAIEQDASLFELCAKFYNVFPPERAQNVAGLRGRIIITSPN
jgi:hypothetical protein